MVTFRDNSNPLRSQWVEGNSLKEEFFDDCYKLTFTSSYQPVIFE